LLIIIVNYKWLVHVVLEKEKRPVEGKADLEIHEGKADLEIHEGKADLEIHEGKTELETVLDINIYVMTKS
jgi:hypothetical protein